MRSLRCHCLQQHHSDAAARETDCIRTTVENLRLERPDRIWLLNAMSCVGKFEARLDHVIRYSFTTLREQGARKDPASLLEHRRGKTTFGFIATARSLSAGRFD